MDKNLILILVFLTLLWGCDKNGVKKCAWFLVPEPRHMDQVSKGMISVCARNYDTNKQRCQLQAKIEFAKKVYGKKFRLSELQFDKSGKFPRTVLSLTPCQIKEAKSG